MGMVVSCGSFMGMQCTKGMVIVVSVVVIVVVVAGVVVGVGKVV